MLRRLVQVTCLLLQTVHFSASRTSDTAVLEHSESSLLSSSPVTGNDCAGYCPSAASATPQLLDGKLLSNVKWDYVVLGLNLQILQGRHLDM